jgi:hypothetical protein
MSDLLDLVVDTFPANNDTAVPLATNITLTLSGLNYNEDSLKEGLFVEGPDTDQYVGPGLLELKSNVSQGDLNDFLESPGYQGIVQGTITVSGISGNTVVTFTPKYPLVPNLTYIVNLTGVLNNSSVEIDGFTSFSFETGTGSIEVIPSTVSTSVLSAGLSEAAILINSSAEPLSVLSTNPLDRSVQIDPSTREIVITFNKEVDPNSVNTDNIIVRTFPATDHPQAVTRSLGDLAKTVEVVGKQVKIKI